MSGPRRPMTLAEFAARGNSAQRAVDELTLSQKAREDKARLAAWAREHENEPADDWLAIALQLRTLAAALEDYDSGVCAFCGCGLTAQDLADVDGRCPRCERVRLSLVRDELVSIAKKIERAKDRR